MKCQRYSNNLIADVASPYVSNYSMRPRHRLTQEVQTDGRQTGSSYISRSTTERHAVPTAIPGFSGSPDSTELVPTSADVDRYRKCTLATAKPEVIIYHVLQQIDTRFSWLLDSTESCRHPPIPET
jgi:hypothetical protein